MNIGSQMVALFGKVVGPLEDGSLLVKKTPLGVGLQSSCWWVSLELPLLSDGDISTCPSHKLSHPSHFFGLVGGAGN